MKDYIVHICGRLQFPRTAIDEYASAYSRIHVCRQALELFEKCVSDYENTGYADFEVLDAAAYKIEAETGVHRFTVSMLMMLAFTRHLKEIYDAKGFGGRMYLDILQDLRCKNAECFQLHGVYGSFVMKWELKIFNILLFCFGRLQFEPKSLENDIETSAGVIKRGTPAVSIHIPSNGRLDIGSCIDSVSRARGFFKEYTVFYCNSWLLYPENHEIITPPSNILKFMDLFEIVSCAESRADLWRIFAVSDTEEIAALPEDTSLRRDFKRRLLCGGSVGVGFGILKSNVGV